MSDYIDGKRPECGRSTKLVHKEKEIVNEPTSLTDDWVNDIANAVIKAIGSKQGILGTKGDFDDKDSLKSMADAMIVQRGSESNFDDLGKVEQNKKDPNDVDKTIDILNNID
ncbi:MAG: hypothetical protein ACOCUH_02860 [Bacteriovoracia bacterium]